MEGRKKYWIQIPAEIIVWNWKTAHHTAAALRPCRALQNLTARDWMDSHATRRPARGTCENPRAPLPGLMLCARRRPRAPGRRGRGGARGRLPVPVSSGDRGEQVQSWPGYLSCVVCAKHCSQAAGTRLTQNRHPSVGPRTRIFDGPIPVWRQPPVELMPISGGCSVGSCNPLGYLAAPALD
jgi:hypothetical protein